MQKVLFKILSSINRAVIPSFARKDLTRLTKFQQAIVAYRLWVTKNSLE